MSILQHLRLRLNLLNRAIMWAAIGSIVMVGLLYQAPAWAATADCPANPTTGNSTIPIAPVELYLTFGGPPSTYLVSLCKDPSAPVNITTTSVPTGNVAIDPVSFSLSSTISKTISVTVATGHPANQPFTVTITHTATSDDPDFDYGSLYVPTVTAYYSPPVAVNDFVAPLFGQSITIDVRANDTDRRGLGLTLPAATIVTGPAHGTATLNVTQTIQYTPTAGYSGPDSFTYRVEGADGNSDVGTVNINVQPAGQTSVVVAKIDPTTGGSILLAAAYGTVDVEIPPLTGVSPDSDVYCTVGEVNAPTGDETSPPNGVGTFTEIALAIQCYVDGVPITPEMLSELATVTISLTPGFVTEIEGARIVVAVWNGTSWQTEGIVLEEVTETTSPGTPSDTVIRFKTPILGEFVVFAVWDIFMPFLERQATAE